MVLTAILFFFLMALPILYMILPSKRQTRIMKYVDKLPGPKKYPIVGTAADVIGLKREQISDYFKQRNASYGPIYRTWLGNLASIQLTKAEYAKPILTSTTNITKSPTYKSIEPWLGQGLLISTGAYWHRNRKLITPAFHFKILENFLQIFNEKSLLLTEKLENFCDGNQFNMDPLITKATLDVICETAMGIQLNALSDNSNEYVNAIEEIAELAIQRIMKPWLKYDYVYYLTDQGKQFKKCLEILHGFTDKVLQDRKRNFSKKTSPLTDVDGTGSRQRLAFLDLMLEASQDGAKLSDLEIRQEIDTFMFAGHDTTSAATSWALFLLGNHLDVQERVREEIFSVLGDRETITMHDLSELKLLERIIKETFRLFPSVPMIARKITEDIKIDKYDLPAGCSVVIHVTEIHRDSDYWEEPDKFDPDRFLPENSKERHPYAFIPFSAGARNCLGQKFALIEEKTFLANILRKFRIRAIEKPETIKVYKEIVMRPQNGLLVTLEKL